mmetsp:Transcript_4992/g.16735  ORF Transcript_4992/g.16735 Transcript_4992/m.16735 type:complete len:298 (-) Transcript_4992:591-1484(-)
MSAERSPSSSPLASGSSTSTTLALPFFLPFFPPPPAPAPASEPPVFLRCARRSFTMEGLSSSTNLRTRGSLMGLFCRRTSCSTLGVSSARAPGSPSKRLSVRVRSRSICSLPTLPEMLASWLPAAETLLRCAPSGRGRCVRRLRSTLRVTSSGSRSRSDASSMALSATLSTCKGQSEISSGSAASLLPAASRTRSLARVPSSAGRASRPHWDTMRLERADSCRICEGSAASAADSMRILSELSVMQCQSAGSRSGSLRATESSRPLLSSTPCTSGHSALGASPRADSTWSRSRTRAS